MAIRAYKPVSPAQRGMTTRDFSDLTTRKPLRSLTTVKKAAIARNNQGRITTRHRGGGARRRYRILDFKMKPGTTLSIEEFEYDPNRSAHIVRVKDQDGDYHYILAAKGMRKSRKLTIGEDASIESGNRLPLRNIPAGTVIHAVELQPGKGAQLARTAGSSAQLVAKEDIYGQVRLPSGEIRLVNLDCMASIGSLSNEQHGNVQIGKAGRKRHMGIRPTVRGVVMAAVDHPHGGGEGKHGTEKDPRTPWGQKTLGYKTRHRRSSNKYIVRTRHQGKRR